MTTTLNTTERRIEALVNGTTALEGFARTGAQGAPAQLWIRPTYLRAGLVSVDASGALRVRPRTERDSTSDAAIESAPTTVRIDATEFCEVWLDGRLAYIAK